MLKTQEQYIRLPKHCKENINGRRDVMYEKFKKLCAEKGVTPYVVSKHTGIAQATLTEWKQGKYTPKIDKIMKIAQFFNVDVSYFYKE